MSEAKYGENSGFYTTEKRLGGRAAYDAAKSAGQTELNYRQWVQVRTPEFKAWFGDWENDPENASKVINPKTGEPLVVYHGTKHEFTVFDAEKSSVNSGNKGHFGQGFYLTPNRDLAQSFAIGGKVMQVFANLRNPLLNHAGHIGKVAELMNVRAYECKKIPEITQNGRRGGSFSRAAASLGFDGIAQADEFSEIPYRNELVVLRPEQIKSATGNSGRFDPYSPDICDPLPDKPEQRITEPERPSENVQTASFNGGSGLGGGLKLALHQYLMQTATLSAEDKQHRTVLEHAMEKTVSGLPADIQAQARINFYRSQIRHIAEKYDISAEHDTGMER